MLSMLATWFRTDTLTGIMLALVAFIGVVILRYSRHYLSGQPGQLRYYGWFGATLAAIAVMIGANHLLILAVAWSVSGLCLHQLLTFFQTRPQSLVAAHKKFLLSRLADLFIFGGVLLIGRAAGTMQIDALLRHATALDTVPVVLHAGGLLLTAGVIIRSAQLPFHSWLIQVMEAPTPVSALLHAGIVNMGGFVMIRLAPLMVQLEFAQLVLVIVGATTAVLAGLVMMTRVSVKVALAWSTCAQMGFMLLECGLGAYELALLHLVAHSLYKAHAFLSSGRRVVDAVQQRATPSSAISPTRLAVGAILGLVIVLAVGALIVPKDHRAPSLAVSGLILAFAIAPLIAPLVAPRAERDGQRSARRPWRRMLFAVAGVALFALWYRVFSALVPSAEAMTTGFLVRAMITVVAFTGLFIVQSIVVHRPAGVLARRLYPHFLAGFYLDEFITFLTFRIWPPRTRRGASSRAASGATRALTEQIA
jgi:NAD(P)H-quinone oxidoreductase subunit 5